MAKKKVVKKKKAGKRPVKKKTPVRKVVKKKSPKPTPQSKSKSSKPNNESGKSTFKNAFQDYVNFKQAIERRDEITYKGDINKLAQTANEEISTPFFQEEAGKQNLEYFVKNIENARQNGDIDTLLSAAGEAYNANVGGIEEKFNSYFDEGLQDLLESTPEDLLVRIANVSYNENYTGKYQDIYGLHKDVVDRSKEFLIIQDEESTNEEKEAASESLREKATKEYETQREPVDNKVMDKVVRNLDIIFGKPIELYQTKTIELNKDFINKLPKNVDYLVEIAGDEKLQGFYQNYFENQLAKEAKKDSK